MSELELVDCTCVACNATGQMSSEQFVCSFAPILCQKCATGSGPLYVLTKKGREVEGRRLKELIKTTLRAKGPFLTPDKILEYVHMPKKTLKALLNEMAREGEVAANGAGAYTTW